MSFKRRIKQMIRTADMFSHNVSFRYNDEPAYESLTGGCISILMMFAFIGIFTTTLSRTINKDFIEFNVNRFDE